MNAGRRRSVHFVPGADIANLDAFAFKGQIVDAPHLNRALKVLARAGE
jgi:citrate lyase beta subunit